MAKKKPKIETESRSMQPEEVQECAHRLAGLIEERRAIKRKQKEFARDFKQQLQANEEEQERLSRMIITQQEEVPLERQATIFDVLDERRHELSLKDFKRESEAFDASKEGESGQPDVMADAMTCTPGEAANA